jgi:hypothetical protein
MKTMLDQYASALTALRNCEAQIPPHPWADTWRERIEALDDLLPRGAGLDLGPRLDLASSTEDRLVFSHCAFHHMNEHGYYDGWSEHTVVVTPGFLGPKVRVTGRDRNGIKDYIGDTFYEALTGPGQRDLSPLEAAHAQGVQDSDA